MSRKMIIGSRRSKLAITQANWVIDQLNQLGLPYTFEIKEIVTKGDRILDRMLSKVGGKGLFIKEIEQALEDEEIDIAVHSMKDVPAQVPAQFSIASIPVREDPRDCLITNGSLKLEELASGSVVGTSSLRRSTQVLHHRPDLKIQWIRGNIDTRLRKLRDNQFDAIILAAAGIKRMGWQEAIVDEYLAPSICLPAVGQGALGIECRSNDQDAIDLVRHIHHDITGREVLAERTFLAEMGGSCEVPVAGYATLDKEDIHLSGLVGSADGQTLISASMQGSDPQEIGVRLADALKQKGAMSILQEIQDQSHIADQGDE